MHDAPPGCHPLDAARDENALVAVVVTMTHPAIEHVGDGLKAPMGMIRETRDVIARVVGAELIEHQERIEIRQARLTDDPRQLDAGTVGCGYPAHHSRDAAY